MTTFVTQCQISRRQSKSTLDTHQTSVSCFTKVCLCLVLFILLCTLNMCVMLLCRVKSMSWCMFMAWLCPNATENHKQHEHEQHCFCVSCERRYTLSCRLTPPVGRPRTHVSIWMGIHPALPKNGAKKLWVTKAKGETERQFKHQQWNMSDADTFLYLTGSDVWGFSLCKRLLLWEKKKKTRVVWIHRDCDRGAEGAEYPPAGK